MKDDGYGPAHTDGFPQHINEHAALGPGVSATANVAETP